MHKSTVGGKEVDKKDGIIYTNLIENFPARSIDGYTTFFILHDWTTNAILPITVKDPTDESTVEAFNKNIKYLAERGFEPVFNVIDNVVSNAIRSYLKEAKVGIQLVKPHNHREKFYRERAIQIFKDHFTTSELYIGVRNFPTILWCKLVQQAVRSLNMLRTSRVYPKVSADHMLEGMHDFNKNPWAPPVTRETILNPPNM